MRQKLFGTWKNRLTLGESLDLADGVMKHLQTEPVSFIVGVCPPMIALEQVRRLLPAAYPVAAQNLVWDDDVSFTGETSASQLIDVGCEYVIIGHSERRIYLGETDETVARKVTTAVQHELIPIICIGEMLVDRKGGLTGDVIRRQFEFLIAPLTTTAGGVAPFVIAYEPAWAISTSKEKLKCSPDEAQANHFLIRSLIRSEWGDQTAESTTLLYGGSVTGQNGIEYFSQPDIDGGLVGTGSQSLGGFLGLISAARSAFQDLPV